MSNLSSCGAFFSGAVNTSVPSPASLTTNSMSCVCVACAPSPAPTFTTSVCAAILLSFSAHVSPLLVSPLRNCTVALYFPGFSAWYGKMIWSPLFMAFTKYPLLAQSASFTSSFHFSSSAPVFFSSKCSASAVLAVPLTSVGKLKRFSSV